MFIGSNKGLLKLENIETISAENNKNEKAVFFNAFNGGDIEIDKVDDITIKNVSNAF